MKDCIEHKGTIDNQGYGKIYGKYAHRASYEMFVKPLQPGQHVCHTCDNRSCINPEHLVAAYHTDNVEDMVLKKRHAHGENHGSAKLTEDDVRKIRSLYENTGNTYQDLANEFGLSFGVVGAIVRREAWKHVI